MQVPSNVPMYRGYLNGEDICADLRSELSNHGVRTTLECAGSLLKIVLCSQS